MGMMECAWKRKGLRKTYETNMSARNPVPSKTLAWCMEILHQVNSRFSRSKESLYDIL